MHVSLYTCTGYDKGRSLWRMDVWSLSRLFPYIGRHRPASSHPSAKCIQRTLIFPLTGMPQTHGKSFTTTLPDFKPCSRESPLGGRPLKLLDWVWRPCPQKNPGGYGGSWRALKAPGRTPLEARLRGRSGIHLKRSEDDLLEVGIEGVTLNPNRK